jgi:hypothetical protein
MQKLYYNAESLDRGIREFEREYGMSTEEFYARYMAGEELPVPRFNQHAWAAFRDDIQRLTDKTPRRPAPNLSEYRQRSDT